MDVSLVVVNYRSSALAIDAIRSARAATSRPLQVIVVDNSVDPAEADALRQDADVVIASERNDGYAAAINRGRRAADGAVIVAANPDVVFASRCIDELLAVSAAVAGPALFWDDAHEWLLPPADLHTFRDRFDHALATRAHAWRRRRDRRRIRERMAFAELRSPKRVAAISGAVMAIRTSAFDAAHGFDERFPLYFEENDFLRRVRGEIVYVPAARCRHIYNQSAEAGTSAETSRLYAISEREYLRKWSGAWAASVVKSIERPEPEIDVATIAGPLDVDESVVVEASPLSSFETAAIHFPRGRSSDLPPEVLSSYRGTGPFVRVVRRATREVLATYRRAKISAWCAVTTTSN